MAITKKVEYKIHSKYPCNIPRFPVIVEKVIWLIDPNVFTVTYVIVRRWLFYTCSTYVSQGWTRVISSK